MPLLIDGNNLLHAARDVDGGDGPGRASLCALLASWGRRRRERITVVFDGPLPPEPFATQIAQTAGELQVLFSGAGKSADRRIEELLDADSAPRRVVVVSTDREVRQAARHRQARSVRADEFWRALRSDLARRPGGDTVEPREKRRGLQGGLEEWLREFRLTTEMTLTDLAPTPAAPPPGGVAPAGSTGPAGSPPPPATPQPSTPMASRRPRTTHDIRAAEQAPPELDLRDLDAFTGSEEALLRAAEQAAVGGDWSLSKEDQAALEAWARREDQHSSRDKRRDRPIAANQDLPRDAVQDPADEVEMPAEPDPAESDDAFPDDWAPPGTQPLK